MALDQRDYMIEKLKERERESERKENLKKAYYFPKQYRFDQGTSAETSAISTAFKTFCILVAAIVLIYAFASGNIKFNNAKGPAAAPLLSNSVFAIEPFPPSGSTRQYVEIHPSRLVSSITIQPTADHAIYHVVRFRHAPTGTTVLDAYIHPGKPTQIWLPQGHFETTVFSGSKWLGPERLFSESQNNPIGYNPLIISAGSHHQLTLRPS